MKRLHFTTLGATVLAVALGVSVDANAQSAASNLANGVGTTNALRSGPAYRTVGPVFVAPSVGVADEPARVESYERSLTETSVAEDVAPVDMDAQKQRALEILEESQRRAKEAKNRRPARKIDVPDTLGVLNRPIQSAPKQTVPNPRFQQYAPSATVPAVADEQTDVPALQSVPRPAAQTFGVSRPPVATSNRKVDAIVDDLDASVPGVAPFPEALEEAPAQPLTTTFMPQIPTVPQTTRPDADALETGTDDGVPTVESDEYDSDFSQSVLEELRPELSNAELDAEPLEETDAPVDNGESATEGIPGEQVFIKTGLSNENYAQVISGLSAGDVVLVTRTASSGSSGNSGSEKNPMNPGSGMDMGSMPSGGMDFGGMPSGGSMPSGERPSGSGQGRQPSGN